MPLIKGKYVPPKYYCGDTGEIEDYDAQFAGFCTSCDLGRKKQAVTDREVNQGDSGVSEPLLSTQVAGDHYKYLTPQPIEVIEAWGIGFHLGAALKYIARAGKKPGSSAKQDIEKAIWFLRRYCEVSDGDGRVTIMEPT